MEKAFTAKALIYSKSSPGNVLLRIDEWALRISTLKSEPV